LLKWLLLGLAVLLLVLVVLMGWIGGTRSGLNFAWSLLAPRLPETLAVADIEGRLIGPLTLTGVKIDNDKKHIVVDELQIVWRAFDLLSANPHVENVSLRGVQYAVKQPSEEESTLLPMLKPMMPPLEIHVDRLDLDDVTATLAPGDEPIVL